MQPAQPQDHCHSKVDFKSHKMRVQCFVFTLICRCGLYVFICVNEHLWDYLKFRLFAFVDTYRHIWAFIMLLL